VINGRLSLGLSKASSVGVGGLSFPGVCCLFVPLALAVHAMEPASAAPGTGGPGAASGGARGPAAAARVPLDLETLTREVEAAWDRVPSPLAEDASGVRRAAGARAGVTTIGVFGTADAGKSAFLNSLVQVLNRYVSAVTSHCKWPVVAQCAVKDFEWTFSAGFASW
jgi:hypothetical protein